MWRATTRSSARSASSPPEAAPASATEQALGAALADLEARALRRRVRVLDSAQGPRVAEGGRVLVNFSSNDYLGLANDARLKAAAHAAIDEFGVGAGASPLVSGNSRLHVETEQRFADFTRLPQAILFGSGYAANLGILAALASRDAEIFSDRLNHACLIDGARLSRAQVTPYAHADMDELGARMAASRAAVKIVASDAVFSMDGDIAPVPELLESCERHDAWLVLDDAHGIGVTGRDGRGTLDHFAVSSPRIVYMATLGKALGGYGACVGATPDVVQWLRQRARTYVYSTALPPAAAAVASRALEVLGDSGSPVAALRERIAQLREACSRRDIRVGGSDTAIHPIVVGTPQRALDISARLESRGLWVPAIRPPTVPDGTSRLRISLSAAHAREDVDDLSRALAEALAD
jgi:8-amino-7-oxononanoate synthase